MTWAAGMKKERDGAKKETEEAKKAERKGRKKGNTEKQTEERSRNETQQDMIQCRPMLTRSTPRISSHSSLTAHEPSKEK